jgi:hypothetical protein
MKPRKPIRKVSSKRAKQNAEYSKRRKAFLEAHPYCQWFLNHHGISEKEAGPLGVVEIMTGFNGRIIKIPLSTEIHHKRGRFGSRLNAEEFWMAVSREGHNWIHNNPKEAYERGYLLRR